MRGEMLYGIFFWIWWRLAKR